MTFDARGIIGNIKKGEVPTAEALVWFAKGLANHTISDAQAGAFAMAVCMNGLNETGLVSLTEAMRDSGETISWQCDGPVLDKHSTGGVGDCVSLVLAPLLAAAGIKVPMISGRGLGHTGGTLDKLEAIPGVKTDIDEKTLRKTIKRIGCAIVSATANIAPADKRLYAIRDVTSTIDSLELITASILSKKLAAGIEGLVLDVKCGTGAFMKNVKNATVLAKALVRTANLAGCKTTALITDMNEPVASSIGNALEVEVAMKVLTEGQHGKLKEISLALGAELLISAGIYNDSKIARGNLSKLLENGQAAEKFGEMVAELGGPNSFMENWSRFLPEAPVILEVEAPDSGIILGWDSEALGLAVVNLGGGRKVETDKINPSVGLSNIIATGEKIEQGKVILRIHASRLESAEKVKTSILSAVKIGSKPPKRRNLVIEKIE